MTRILQEAFGASCFMEYEYPYRLCVQLRDAPVLSNGILFVTFDKRGSVLSIQVSESPANISWDFGNVLSVGWKRRS